MKCILIILPGRGKTWRIWRNTKCRLLMCCYKRYLWTSTINAYSCSSCLCAVLAWYTQLFNSILCVILKVLQEILEGNIHPLRVSRILTCINGKPLGTYALNDVLLAHPNPAAVTRCSLRYFCKTEMTRFLRLFCLSSFESILAKK